MEPGDREEKNILAPKSSGGFVLKLSKQANKNHMSHSSTHLPASWHA